MFVRLVIPTIVVFGAAWMLVQPDTPRPDAAASIPATVAAETEDAPGSAIELLGDTWTANAPERPMPPEPIVRPLTAAEHAAAIAAIRQREAVGASRDQEVSQISNLRRPVPRPATQQVASRQPVVEAPTNTVVVVQERGAYWDDPPPVIVLRGGEPVATPPSDAGLRWVVRRQGSGDVIAEVSLAEALAILTSR